MAAVAGAAGIAATAAIAGKRANSEVEANRRAFLAGRLRA
jgi:hypothetical protein